MWIRPVNFINTRIFHQPTCCLFLMARALALLQQMSGKKWHDCITMIQMRQAERNQCRASLSLISVDLFGYLLKYLLMYRSLHISFPSLNHSINIYHTTKMHIYMYINKNICKQYYKQMWNIYKHKIHTHLKLFSPLPSLILACFLNSSGFGPWSRKLQWTRTNHWCCCVFCRWWWWWWWWSAQTLIIPTSSTSLFNYVPRL